VPPSHDAVPHDPNLVHIFAPSSPATTAESAPQAAPVETASDAMPRFTIAIGGGAADAHGLVSSTGAAAHDHDDDDAPVPERSVSSPARLAQGGAPAYPAEAREDGVEADVPVEIVVSAAGAVESARVVKRAGHGLDEAALAAVRRYRFSPANKDGRAVRVRMRWTVQFRLR
jgi:protein TonB